MVSDRKRLFRKISSTIDPLCVEYPILEDCVHRKEAEYNQAIFEKNEYQVVCLDKTNIAPKGNVEPCDLLILEEDKAVLVHIKISTRSSMLSHLFNQGITSLQLMRMDSEALEKLVNLLPDEKNKEPISKQSFEVVYGIISAKPSERKSKNLPIFSRISLVRTIRDFQLMNIPVKIVFIKDLVDRKTGKNKEN